MFWDRIKDSIKKSEGKTSESKTEAEKKESEKVSENGSEKSENSKTEVFDENLTSDVDEELLEFRLKVAREKLEQKGVPKEELEEIFAKIRKDKSGESLKSLLAELD